MRYIQIPPAATYTLGGTEKAMLFKALLDEVVYTSPKWREDSSKHQMLFDLMEKFDGSKAGDWIELSEAEYEQFHPVAVMTGEKLQPFLAVALNKLFKPIIAAPSKLPEGAAIRGAEPANDAALESGEGEKKAS